MTSRNIIIIDQNEKNLNTLTKLLESNDFGVNVVKDKNSFEDMYKFKDNILFLVSIHLDFVSIEEVFSHIEYCNDYMCPVIFIDSSKEHDKKMLNKCFELGAVDYIKKPFDSTEIILRISRHIEIFTKTKEYRLRVDKLSNLATTDQVSKLSSKAHMFAILKHTVDLLSRQPRDVCVVSLRLIEMDRIFTTFGLGYGEKLILLFSKELKKLLRSSDVASRWVGVDFIILLENIDLDNAQKVMQKLYTTLSNTEVMKDIKPNLAIGIAKVNPDGDINSVVEKAQYAMRNSAKDRYNRVSISE